MKLPEWAKIVKGSLKADDKDPVVIMMCEPVGVDPLTYRGMSSRTFGELLSMVPADKDIRLLINTLGGDVHEGTGMHSMTIERGNVDTVVIGCAASMGAVLFQAGRRRTMYPGTMLMIHNPYYPDGGKGEGNVLEVTTQNLVDLLAKRTGVRRDTISKMMADTTAMGPDEAKRLGFCDAIENPSAKNEFELPGIDRGVEMLCRMLNSAAQRPPAPGEIKKEQAPMKKLLAALAAAKITTSAELTDEAAESAVNKFVTDNAAALGQVPELQNRVKKYEEAQKKRVESAVDKAIADKVLPAERRDKMVARGVADEADLTEALGDLYSLKGAAASATPEKRHTVVPPVAAGEGSGDGKPGESVDDQIKALQASMKDKPPGERASICRKIRELRGNGEAFTGKKAS
jgi:ATP-dependent protease ClpP protease subunit